MRMPLIRSRTVDEENIDAGKGGITLNGDENADIELPTGGLWLTGTGVDE